MQPRGCRQNTKATGRKGSLKSKKRLVNNTTYTRLSHHIVRYCLSEWKRQFALPQLQKLKLAGEEHKPGRRGRREPGLSKSSRSEKEEETSRPLLSRRSLTNPCVSIPDSLKATWSEAKPKPQTTPSTWPLSGKVTSPDSKGVCQRPFWTKQAGCLRRLC